MLAKTGGNLRQYVIGHASTPWRLITRQVIDQTGQDVTQASITGWFRDDEEVQAARADARAARADARKAS